jgi:hypothetical protein
MPFTSLSDARLMLVVAWQIGEDVETAGLQRMGKFCEVYEREYRGVKRGRCLLRSFWGWGLWEVSKLMRMGISHVML